jgi:uncharacterized protein
MTPLLVLVFGIHPQTAVGTDLLYASATKTVGTLVHGMERTVNWSIVGLLAVGSVPAALVSVAVLSRLGPQGARESQLISVTLGLALFATAVSIMFKNRIAAFSQSRPDMSPALRRGLTIATGATLGVLVTLSSVGAGAIGVTALFFLYPRLTAAEIVGSDVAHAVPLTLVAGLGHLLLGSINWAILLSLLLGSIPGIILGSLSATRVPEVFLRPVLAAVLVVVGYRLIFV